MNDKLPDFLQGVIEEYPDVWKTYQALGEACSNAGPLWNRKPSEAGQTCIGDRCEVRGRGAFPYATRPPRRDHTRGTTTGRTARSDFHRLVVKHGSTVLDSGCGEQTITV